MGKYNNMARSARVFGDRTLVDKWAKLIKEAKVRGQ